MTSDPEFPAGTDLVGADRPGTDRAAEVAAAVAAFVATRERIERGEETWTALERFYTDDAVYIDPAWGRITGGLAEIREFFDESMRGLEDWKFPVEFTAIDGDDVVVKWTQILPVRRADGTSYQQSGISTMRYAGDGKFSYQEDLLNMTHVLEDLAASGWRPGPGFVMPPATPNRDWSRPAS